MNLIFVGDRCNDHSPNSGYDQVCSLFPDAGWLSGRALEAGRLEWHRDSRESATTANQVLHVIYGDCSGKALPALLRKRFPEARIISSVHRPIHRLKEDGVACGAMKASDAIVAMAEVQARELADMELDATISFIPHGVWTRVFRPISSLTGQRRQDVLLVGSFLRDWDGAKQVGALLAEAGVRAVAVGAGARDNLAGNDAHIDVLPRVSECELAEMYQQSAAVFLPFMDATASNALLESMSAGCPIICPRMPSLIDYLGDDSDSFDPGRYDIAASKILHHVRNPSERDARARCLMARAETFDWSRLKPRYEAIYADGVARS